VTERKSELSTEKEKGKWVLTRLGEKPPEDELRVREREEE
jgi:hypothetical protein